METKLGESQAAIDEVRSNMYVHVDVVVALSNVCL